MTCFINLIRAVFKLDDPFGLFPTNDAFNTDRNLLCLALSNIYVPLVREFSSIQFTSEK